MRSLLTGLLGIVAVLSAGPVLASEAGSNTWYTDFAAAQQQARHLNRPMILHFHATYCGPCKRMEREVLNSPEVRGLLGVRVIGVKIDGEQNVAIRNQFKVTAYPTDVIVDSDGRVIAQLTPGFKAKGEYVATLVKYSPAPTAPPVEKANTAVVSTQTKAAPAVTSQSEIEIGLEGYCPVSLFKTRAWKHGDKTFAYEYEGQRFYMAGAEELKLFKDNPEKYAPRILGCDPVRYTRKNEVIAGSTKFAAYFDGGLYLFENDTSRKEFKADPVKFTRVQQVRADNGKRQG